MQCSAAQQREDHTRLTICLSAHNLVQSQRRSISFLSFPGLGLGLGRGSFVVNVHVYIYVYVYTSHGVRSKLSIIRAPGSPSVPPLTIRDLDLELVGQPASCLHYGS